VSSRVETRIRNSRGESLSPDREFLSSETHHLFAQIARERGDKATRRKAGDMTLWLHRHVVGLLSRPFSSWLIRCRVIEALQSRDTVVDVAAGDDTLCIDLAKRGKTVLVNDLSIGGLNYLQRRARAAGVDGKVGFIRSDARNLPIRMPLDAAVVKNLLHHLRDSEDIRETLFRILRVVRRIVLVEIEDPRHSFLARVWNLYYRKVLGDDGHNFIDVSTFHRLVAEMDSAATVHFIRTVKGRYLFVVIDAPGGEYD